MPSRPRSRRLSPWRSILGWIALAALVFAGIGQPHPLMGIDPSILHVAASALDDFDDCAGAQAVEKQKAGTQGSGSHGAMQSGQCCPCVSCLSHLLAAPTRDGPAIVFARRAAADVAFAPTDPSPPGPASRPSSRPRAPPIAV
jgi:hypothetical protein